ncbi:beta-lactamase/D-alanine carboxypeptidase [Rickettsiales bacterium Ac37b]|nr:beta-lactamase/D-alanine carboxypeptidase [Rickettsiales bacterium Ac37b]
MAHKLFDSITLGVMQKLQIPAIALGIIKKGSVIFKKTYGVCGYDNHLPINSKTLFQIASLSKGFLGILISMLVDNDILNWEDKISNLSLKQIACMNTGLEENFGSTHLKENYNKHKFVQILIKELLCYNKVLNIDFSYQYAVLLLLEEIIESKTNVKWEQLLYSKILYPLHLYNTGTNITKKISETKNIAIPYNNNNIKMNWETFQVNSAAGMYSCLDDMLVWLNFHLLEGIFDNKRIVSLIEMQKLYNIHTRVEKAQCVDDWDVIVSTTYGYFWYNLNLSLGNKRLTIIEHNGDCCGMSSLISYIPQEQIGMVILTNKQTVGPYILRRKFLEHIFAY